jgi:uncharacterized protein (TIGR02300 family)
LSKPELGTKRLCGSCGAKFYDLNKDPIACPACATVFVVPTPVTRRAPTAAGRTRPQPFAAPAPAEEAAPSVLPPAEFEQAKSEAETAEEEIGIGASHDDAILIDADEEEDDIKKPEEI